MNITFKHLIKLGLISGLSLCMIAPITAADLQDGAVSIRYTFINENGETEGETKTTTAQVVNGKIDDHTITGVPVKTDGTYLVEILDSNGTVVRKCIVEPPKSTNEEIEAGVTELSTNQAKAMEAAMETADSNDPILQAFILMTLKVKDAPDDALDAVANTVLKAIVTGEGNNRSFVQYLTDETSASQVATFRSELKKLLKGFGETYKEAVEETTEDNFVKKMGKAGGRIADYFIEAAFEARIDLSTIMEAFDSAGSVAGSNQDWQTVETSFPEVAKTVNSSIESFFTRLDMAQLTYKYSRALTAIGATQSQINRYASALTTLRTAIELADEAAIIKTYDSDNIDNIQTEVNDIYRDLHTNGFGAFQTAIAATYSELNTLKNSIATAMELSSEQFTQMVGSDFGKETETQNWPITMVASLQKIADIINNGGSLTYTRDTVAIADEPNQNMLRPGVLENRIDFSVDASGAPQSFVSWMGLEQDVHILEWNQEVAYVESEQNQTDDRDIIKTYRQGLQRVISSLGGTLDGSTSIPEEVKKAFVVLLSRP